MKGAILAILAGGSELSSAGRSGEDEANSNDISEIDLS